MQNSTSKHFQSISTTEINWWMTGTATIVLKLERNDEVWIKLASKARIYKILPHNIPNEMT